MSSLARVAEGPIVVRRVAVVAVVGFQIWFIARGYRADHKEFVQMFLEVERPGAPTSSG